MAEPNETKYELTTLLSADGTGPAASIGAAQAERLIANVLDAVQVPAAAAALPARKSRRTAFFLLAALVITGSAAAMYRAQRAAEERVDADRAERAAKPAIAIAPRASAPEPALRPAEPAPLAVAKPSAVRAPEPKSSVVRVADDLLERANRLRGTGDYRAAERTYLQVIAQRPAGPAAYSARVAAAELRLEQLGDAKGALRMFEQALRSNPNGALAPEVHEGMAHAYRALGKSGAERDALRALLAKQASGPAAERARARLRALDAAP